MNAAVFTDRTVCPPERPLRWADRAERGTVSPSAHAVSSAAPATPPGPQRTGAGRETSINWGAAVAGGKKFQRTTIFRCALLNGAPKR